MKAVLKLFAGLALVFALVLGSQYAEALLQLLLDFQNEHKNFSIITEE